MTEFTNKNEKTARMGLKTLMWSKESQTQRMAYCRVHQ